MTGGTLWLVSTPIGNLGDLPPRAVEILSSTAMVCCEDTRRTGRLLQHAGIRADRLAVVNAHTEFQRTDEVLSELGDGRDVAVVTDAGTPAISDPGERLVAAAIESGYEVSAVPGPVAAVMALTISGLPTARFTFEGFLPRSGRARSDRLAAIAVDPRTVVLYEAPHRVERTIADLVASCGPARTAAVCRELTKLHESVIRGPIGSIDLGTPRGEYVIVLAGASGDPAPVTDDDIIEALRLELDAGASTRDAVSTIADRFGVSRNSVYALAIADR